MDSGRIRVVSKARQPIPQCFLIRPWRGRVQPAIRKDMSFKPTVRKLCCCAFRCLPIPCRVQREDIPDLVSIRSRKRLACGGRCAWRGRGQGGGLNGPLRCGWKGGSKPQGRQE
jgi:hypothetical protein